MIAAAYLIPGFVLFVVLFLALFIVQFQWVTSARKKPDSGYLIFQLMMALAEFCAAEKDLLRLSTFARHSTADAEAARKAQKRYDDALSGLKVIHKYCCNRYGACGDNYESR